MASPIPRHLPSIARLIGPITTTTAHRLRWMVAVAMLHNIYTSQLSLTFYFSSLTTHFLNHWLQVGNTTGNNSYPTNYSDGKFQQINFNQQTAPLGTFTDQYSFLLAVSGLARRLTKSRLQTISGQVPWDPATSDCLCYLNQN